MIEQTQILHYGTIIFISPFTYTLFLIVIWNYDVG